LQYTFNVWVLDGPPRGSNPSDRRTAGSLEEITKSIKSLQINSSGLFCFPDYAKIFNFPQIFGEFYNLQILLTKISVTYRLTTCLRRKHLVLIRLARLLLFNFLT
jgi:hypothetical protein